MTRSAVRRLAQTLAFLSLFASVAFLASCGGGGVSGPAATTGPLAISPSSATAYSELPTQFVITGGTAPYFITSSNGTALPVPGSPFNYNTLTLVPGAVGTDTTVTLSATDAKNSTTVSSTVVIKPRTVSNVVTITPSVTCSGALCSGADAAVSVVLTQAGVPLVGRTVRFTVVSGALGVVTFSDGSTVVLSQTGTAVTDATGTARITVRAAEGAPLQTALLDITDVATGATVRTAITIVPPDSAAAPPLNAQPSTLAFQGTDAGTCASGISADVIVFGGKPPYQVSQPGTFAVSPIVVTSSGGRFTVTATGQCSSGTSIAVVDSNGATVTVTASNKLSDLPVTPTPSPFVVAPTAVELTNCNDVATVTLSGGSDSYFATSGNSSIAASVDNNIGTIRRVSTSTAPGSSSVEVRFSDGSTSQIVNVTLSGDATGACPTRSPLTINPTSVTLTSCTDAPTVTVTGGNPGIFGYTQLPRNSGISIGGFDTFFTVKRTPGSAAPPSPTFVDVSDGTAITTLQVNVSGAAAGPC